MNLLLNYTESTDDSNSKSRYTIATQAYIFVLLGNIRAVPCCIGLEMSSLKLTMNSDRISATLFPLFNALILPDLRYLYMVSIPIVNFFTVAGKILPLIRFHYSMLENSTKLGWLRHVLLTYNCYCCCPRASVALGPLLRNRFCEALEISLYLIRLHKGRVSSDAPN